MLYSVLGEESGLFSQQCVVVVQTSEHQIFYFYTCLNIIYVCELVMNMATQCVRQYAECQAARSPDSARKKTWRELLLELLQDL